MARAVQAQRQRDEVADRPEAVSQSETVGFELVLAVHARNNVFGVEHARGTGADKHADACATETVRNGRDSAIEVVLVQGHPSQAMIATIPRCEVFGQAARSTGATRPTYVRMSAAESPNVLGSSPHSARLQRFGNLGAAATQRSRFP